MTIDRRKLLKGAVAAPLAAPFVSSLGIISARAQSWPSRNITIVVAFPPGGAADLAARPVAQAMQEVLGKTVIIDNKAGAAGLIGNAAVARAEPDGHTLLMALSSMTTLPESERLYDRKPSYEYQQLMPVARVTADPVVFAVRADSPYKTFADFMADAKKRPGEISFSSSGNYGATHLPFAMLEQAANIKLLHVPYRGGGPALTAFIGSQVDVTSQGPAPVMPFVRDGRARLIAHWGSERTPDLEGVPTIAELGYRDVVSYIWAGLFAPPGTPEPIMTKLRETMKKIMGDPATRAMFAKAGSPAAYQDAPEFKKFVDADAERMIPVIRKIGRLDEKN
jgi:tripartite-type tricarboxylate transporter receptor subunit TctC